MDNVTALTFRGCGLCNWCVFALARIVKCQYYDILYTVSVLFVVFSMGNVSEYDKSMQLRIIPNQKPNRNLDEIHEISRNHSRNQEITLEISSLREII